MKTLKPTAMSTKPNKQRTRDRDYAAIRTAILRSPGQWDKEILLECLENAGARGWTGKALKAYAWAFWNDGRSQSVTPNALRTALFFGLTPDDTTSPYVAAAEAFHRHYTAQPSRYAFVR